MDQITWQSKIEVIQIPILGYSIGIVIELVNSYRAINSQKHVAADNSDPASFCTLHSFHYANFSHNQIMPYKFTTIPPFFSSSSIIFFLLKHHSLPFFF